MNQLKVIIYSVSGFLAFLFLNASFFIVTEGEQAIITQFGRPVGQPIGKAGAYFKIPFLQEVRRVEKRLLTWDGYPNQIPTKDKKYIKVDTTARWRIVDSLKFIQTLQNERGAMARLDAILDAATRDVISNNNLPEAVRNSNSIIDKVESDLKKVKTEEVVVEDEVTGDIEKIFIGREKLSEMIAKAAAAELLQFGIELIDVQLRRISYEKSVEAKVYERMISERQRIAQKIRSIGQGERAKIEGRLSKDLQQIESEAYRKAQEIRGKGDAEALRIYAQSLGQGKEFYEFQRTLEAYKKSLSEKSSLILSTDSEFFKLLKKE